VWFFAVGQGDAVLVETPGGKHVLIDGGPDRTVLTKVGQTLPPWKRRLDALVLTHPDADHVTGLAAVLERYAVDVVYESGRRGGSGADRFLAEWDVRRESVRAGDTFELDGVRFDVLWPDYDPRAFASGNAASVVLRLTFGETSILLTGDIEKAEERALAAALPPTDVLKIAHHGSATSSDPAFLDAAQPAFAVVQAGEGNAFGHPVPLVVDRLRQRGIRLWRTDADGDVVLRAAGGEPILEARPLPF